jgi:4-hydroxy-2-oxoheptanedioate aldolase
MKNHLRSMIDRKEPAFGIAVRITDASVVELVGIAGFDFVFLDLEHTGMGLETLQNHFRAALAHGIGTLVRLPGFDPAFMLRILDIGAEGILIPGLRSQQEVADAVSAARFPPDGHRGVSGNTRAADFGGHRLPSNKEVTERLNEQLVVGVMIEDVDAVNEVDAIVHTPGLDFVFIGPEDLSASMGHVGVRAHPAVRAAVESILVASEAAGMRFGTMAALPTLPLTVAELSARHASLILLGGDTGLLLAGLRDAISKVKASAE